MHVHHNIKIICDEEPQKSLQNVRKKSFAIRLLVSYGKTVIICLYLPPIDKYDLHRHNVLLEYYWSVLLVFRREGITYGPHSTR